MYYGTKLTFYLAELSSVNFQKQHTLPMIPETTRLANRKFCFLFLWATCFGTKSSSFVELQNSRLSGEMWSSPVCEVNDADIGTTAIPEQSTSHNGEAHSDSNRHVLSLLRFDQVL